jgi:hypothetical protein
MVARLTINPEPTPDFVVNWRTMAEVILSGGEPYADKWDNKTPVWEYFHVLLYLTGQAYAVLLVALTLVNGATAYLLSRLSERLEITGTPLLAGAAYLVVLGVSNGFTANSRQFATFFLLLALFARQPVRIGALTAIACLFHQYYALLIPVVVAFHWWIESPVADRPEWFARFSGTGLAVVASTYLSVAILWGWNAVVAAVNYSVLGITGFISRGAATGDAIWRGPTIWLKTATNPIQHSPGALLVVVFATAGIGVLFQRDRRKAVWLAGYICLSAIPLLIDPVLYYWIAPAGPLAVAVTAVFRPLSRIQVSEK